MEVRKVYNQVKPDGWHYNTGIAYSLDQLYGPQDQINFLHTAVYHFSSLWLSPNGID